MKIRKIQVMLFSAVILLAACSKDTEKDTAEPQELIVGEWLFISENDYRCGTEEVVVERLGSDQETVKTMVFTEDGAYMNYDDGVLDTAEDQMGTWEYAGNGNFIFYYTVNGEARSSTSQIEFDGENIMKLGIDSECFMQGDQSLYTYSVYNRR